ncbi:MAG: SDR family oxidoreductase [Candidatus Omnitrophica bacterium]|nr:SDR family oxidoreductase [Candidatus Omnitrophota bacterium]
MELKGKVALITGAARRVGREIALILAQHGTSIVIHYRRSQKEALDLKKKVKAFGVEACLVRADFSSQTKPLQPMIRHFVSAIYRKVHRVDILINNAAIFYPTPFGKIKERDWDEFFTVNLKAPFFLAQEVGMRMAKAKSGKIINIADWTGFRPYMRYLPYAISKSGLMTATVGLAKNLAPHVQVNSIAPGPILPARGMTPQQMKIVSERTLLKRFGDPRDIAETVRFLCAAGDFITGALIPVDGGALIA